MSDKNLQTRKTLTLTTGIYGISTITGFVTAFLKWLVFGGLSTFGFFGILALLILGFNYVRKSYVAFGDNDYGKSNQNGLLGALSSIGATILAFML